MTGAWSPKGDATALRRVQRGKGRKDTKGCAPQIRREGEGRGGEGSSVVLTGPVRDLVAPVHRSSRSGFTDCAGQELVWFDSTRFYGRKY